ncbi:MAG: hypothetical protein LBH67_02505 [Rickettsia sp.]|jgi:guanylate kinase|nr:hypothetical protein [Rickettsia sp.]
MRKILTEQQKEELITRHRVEFEFSTVVECIRRHGQDSQQAIRTTYPEATKEIEHAKFYDYVVINDDFAATVSTIYFIIVAERTKRIRLNLDKFYSNWYT